MNWLMSTSFRQLGRPHRKKPDHQDERQRTPDGTYGHAVVAGWKMRSLARSALRCDVSSTAVDQMIRWLLWERPNGAHPSAKPDQKLIPFQMSKSAHQGARGAMPPLMELLLQSARARPSNMPYSGPSRSRLESRMTKVGAMRTTSGSLCSFRSMRSIRIVAALAPIS